MTRGAEREQHGASGWHVSIRTTLIGGTILILVAAFASLSALAVSSINQSVVREAQGRVDRNLTTLMAYLGEQRAQLARLVADESALARLDESLAPRLRRTREELALTLLNACAADGTPLAGTHPVRSGRPVRVPVARDPILRKALEGRAAHGTIVLDAARLELEGGPALRQALEVHAPGPRGARRATSAIFWWMARPILDPSGEVRGVIYGGRALNHNTEVVDRMRDLLFGSERHRGKPLGTVTIFLDGVRVATNVLGPDGTRAVGTLVSREVRERVIEGGQRWKDRAWVVDASYLSGYLPLGDAEGRGVGMLYVGLLEAPYVELKQELIRRFALRGSLALGVAVVLALLVIRRIVNPLRRLSAVATGIGEGHWEHGLQPSGSFREIDALERAFARMHDGIKGRDQVLREKNQMLEQLNDRLVRTNRNYMEMLGFVTHEMRSPVAAMQSLADTLSAGLAGALPERALELTSRISRNAVELQDMVRDYLALSRLERGELEARPVEVELVKEVLRDALEQCAPELSARGMTLTVDESPESLRVCVDPDLVRVALVNFLSNAAKYGASGGWVKVSLRAGAERFSIQVRNQGPGFTEAEAATLFQKFTRLRNEATRGRRGSGLGLFLCREIATLHGGAVRADSRPGEWAELTLELPRRPLSMAPREMKDPGGDNVPGEAGAADR